MTPDLKAYTVVGYKRVDGWLTEAALKSIVELSNVQKRMGITGAVSEIGVHHGRLFILLHLLTQAPEISVAWDLFESQHQNVDDSGRGDRRMFELNLARHGCDLSRIKIHAINSLNLTVAKIIAECESRVRLFSVDGGHTADTTYNDLNIAVGSLCEGGVILVDDFFNADWPGVAEGACRYLQGHEGHLCPVAIVGNKFIWTNRRPMAPVYSRALYDLHCRSGCRVKKSSAFGSEVLTITPYGDPHSKFAERTMDYLSDTKIWKRARYTGPGRFLKLVLRQLRDV
jgi:hypothetical protein